MNKRWKFMIFKTFAIAGTCWPWMMGDERSEIMV